MAFAREQREALHPQRHPKRVEHQVKLAGGLGLSLARGQVVVELRQLHQLLRVRRLFRALAELLPPIL